jgi:outer membrane receptor protein involved in Fe transport
VWRRASVDVNGAFIGSFADTDSGLFSPSFTENPGHHTWDARIAWKLTAQLTGLLAIDNLTNQDYSEPLGYQPLLRAVRAGVRIGF